MQITSFRQRLAHTLGIFGFVLLALPSPAAALTIGPPTSDVTMDPGNSSYGVLKIYNEDVFPITVYPIVMNFGADAEEGGVPQMYPATVEDTSGRGLAKWINVDATALTLQPEERLELPYTINVPQNASPGGHYGAIILSTSPPAQGGGTIGIGQQLASLILVRVTGEVDERGGIAEFGFADPQVHYGYLPVDFFLRFENNGNTHIRPVGNLFIKNVFGRQVASIKINDSFRGILPLSTRRFDFGWAHSREDSTNWSELKKEWKNFAIGKYTATLVVNYGEKNQIVTDTRVFYVWPKRLMAIFGVGLVVVLLAAWMLKRAYDKRLIKNFERMQKGPPKT